MLSPEQIARIMAAAPSEKSFTLELDDDVKQTLKQELELDLSGVKDVPFRWVTGDTPVHTDHGVHDFKHTYLVYLTDSEGEFIVDGASHAITKGAGFVFPAGTQHETRGTGSTPRLILGPMDERGAPVGRSTFETKIEFTSAGWVNYINENGLNSSQYGNGGVCISLELSSTDDQNKYLITGGSGTVLGEAVSVIPIGNDYTNYVWRGFDNKFSTSNPILTNNGFAVTNAENTHQYKFWSSGSGDYFIDGYIQNFYGRIDPIGNLAYWAGNYSDQTFDSNDVYLHNIKLTLNDTPIVSNKPPLPPPGGTFYTKIEFTSVGWVNSIKEDRLCLSRYGNGVVCISLELRSTDDPNKYFITGGSGTVLGEAVSVIPTGNVSTNYVWCNIDNQISTSNPILTTDGFAVTNAENTHQYHFGVSDSGDYFIDGYFHNFYGRIDPIGNLAYWAGNYNYATIDGNDSKGCTAVTVDGSVYLHNIELTLNDTPSVSSSPPTPCPPPLPASGGVNYNSDGTIVINSSDTAYGDIEIKEGTRFISDNAFFGNTCITSITFNKDGALTTIGAGAFADCPNLIGPLTIPNSVTTIGEGAFGGCFRLTGSLTIPTSVETIGAGAFARCFSLTGTLTILEGVTTIGASAFSECYNLIGSLTIPTSVTMMGDYAFNGCSTLTGPLTILGGVTTIGEGAFAGCSDLTGSLTIPTSVETIGENAFASCFNLTGSLTIPTSVTTIGVEAFAGCSGLTGSLTILEGVKTIEYGAFFRCSGLTGSLTIPTSVETIEASAFEECSGLTGQLTILEGVTTIGERAFASCSKLTGSLKIPTSVTTIGEWAFASCYNLTGPLTIPSSVTTIGYGAFSGCYNLTGLLTIPDRVTTIEYYAFAFCYNLTGPLTIPSSVTTIKDYAFAYCFNLTGPLTIPTSVTMIGDYAFGGCFGLTSVNILGDGYDLVVGLNPFDLLVEFPEQLSGIASAKVEDSIKSLIAGKFMKITYVSVSPEWNSIYKVFGENGVPIITEEGRADGVNYNSDGTIVLDSSTTAKGDIIIKAGTTLISDNAFFGNKKITSITFNTDGKLTTIGAGAFAYCSKLTGSLTIPDSVTTIGKGAFALCSGLGSSEYVFEVDAKGTVRDSHKPPLGPAIESLSLRAAEPNSGLTGSLTIPDRVTTIGALAFAYCFNLTGPLTIPSSVTMIGNYAFGGCFGLTSVNILGDGSNLEVGLNPFDPLVDFPDQLSDITPAEVRELIESLIAGKSMKITFVSVSPDWYSIYMVFGENGVPIIREGGGGGVVPCFLADAPVLTPTGYRPIATLRVGDLVSTPSGTSVPILKVKVKPVIAGADVNPYVIKKGQFGATKRLLISPNHRVKTDSGMVEARRLGLRQEEMGSRFTYYNLELPNWENMIVAGVTVESLAPVKRITMTMQEFKGFITERYGHMTPELYTMIKRSSYILPDGRISWNSLKK